MYFSRVKKLIFILAIILGAAQPAMATPVAHKNTHKSSIKVQPHRKITSTASVKIKTSHKGKHRTIHVAKKTTKHTTKKLAKVAKPQKQKQIAKKTLPAQATITVQPAVISQLETAPPPRAVITPTIPTLPTIQLAKESVMPAPYAPVKVAHAGGREGIVASMSHRLVDFVHKTVSTLRYSAYKFGGSHFDTSRGVYILDCSRYVDNVLQEVYPEAYSNLVDYSGADTPTSQHYYNFFTDLSSDDQSSYWHKINDVERLRAGDILVFRYKNSGGKPRGGHVMVVMDKPIFDSDAFLVKVADSAPSRHSQDTRLRHNSGIGIGTLLLKANPRTGHPSAFAWGTNSYWNGNVDIAMARPVDVG